MLTDSERRELLDLARSSIAARVVGSLPAVPRATGTLATPCGAFVTIWRQGTLRGCIGHIENDEPLALVVARCAAAASTDDPRFPPMTPDDLPDVDLEISVLGPIESITRPEEVEVGRHGLLVEHGARRGLLLPQVATEWNWDGPTFLAQTCVKAGLRPDAWKSGAQVYRFEAEVFGERT